MLNLFNISHDIKHVWRKCNVDFLKFLDSVKVDESLFQNLDDLELEDDDDDDDPDYDPNVSDGSA